MKAVILERKGDEAAVLGEASDSMSHLFCTFLDVLKLHNLPLVQPLFEFSKHGNLCTKKDWIDDSI